MDFNVTEKAFAINELIYESCQEQPIDCEINLPEYCADISRILKCSVNPRIDSKQVSGDRISVEGTTLISLIYCDDRDMIKCYETTVNFSKIFDIGTEVENSLVKVKVNVDYVNSRPISARKIDIHGSFKICLKVLGKKDVKMICDAQGAGVQLKKKEFVAESFVNSSTKLIVLDEVIDVGQSKPQILSILKADASAAINDFKVITNKVIVKGEATVKMLYTSDFDNNQIEELETTFPISQIVDVNGVDEDCLCNAEMNVESVNLKQRTDATGECRTVSAEIVLSAEIVARRPVMIPVINDAYSTDYSMNLNSANNVFQMQGDRINDSIVCKKQIELPVNEVTRIQSVWCNAQIIGTRVEERKIIINGIVTSCILACDENNRPFYVERPIDFEYMFKPENSGDNIKCEPTVCVASCSYNLQSANQIEVRCELIIKADVLTEYSQPVVTSIEIDDLNPVDKNALSSLTIYFAEPGESVWSIAKKYNTSIETIMADNNLATDTIADNKMLLITSV